jgi:ketosteroid isomerase-like protein
MSQENVETLRKLFAVVNDRGIGGAIEEFEDLLDPSFRLEEAEDLPDPETHTGGKQAFIANMGKLEEVFDEVRMEPLEFVDLDDKIVVVVSMYGRGRGSGAPVEMTFTQLWSVRDGKAVSLRDFATKSEALKAAGLSHQDARTDS